MYVVSLLRAQRESERPRIRHYGGKGADEARQMLNIDTVDAGHKLKHEREQSSGGTVQQQQQVDSWSTSEWGMPSRTGNSHGGISGGWVFLVEAL